jgi:predicted nucleotidyltransferase component of viral defense system
MIYLNTVESRTFEVLEELMEVKELSNFALVGGTNLSLRFGHRVSVDLDLFTNERFFPDEVFKGILNQFPSLTKINERGQSLWLNIENIKVDIILHEYPYLDEVETISEIRFLSVKDIIPMKLEAMASRGVKKDFWDIYELLKHFNLLEMQDFYERKYVNSDFGHVLLSMTYFKDAEIQKENPIALNGVTWAEVKEKMLITVRDYSKGLF